MAWFYVLLAAIIEVFWVIGLRYSESFIEWTGTAFIIALSFYFIIKACEKLPSGTVYAVFTGSGAAVIVLVDTIYFGASLSSMKVFSLLLIVTGVVGIKLTTDSSEPQNETIVSENEVK